MPSANCNSLFTELYEIIKKLRGPDGCPWDQKQTPESIRKYLLEEAQELADAVSTDNDRHVCEEIGDLFFILLMIARMYEEKGSFELADALSSITKKMIGRHPHVFAGAPTGSEAEMKERWEAIKAKEKKSL